MAQLDEPLKLHFELDLRKGRSFVYPCGRKLATAKNRFCTIMVFLALLCSSDLKFSW